MQLLTEPVHTKDGGAVSAGQSLLKINVWRAEDGDGRECDWIVDIYPRGVENDEGNGHVRQYLSHVELLEEYGDAVPVLHELVDVPKTSEVSK
ncbi:hypothetical protein [Agromyces sp. GXS1127]|uniref:hypothetical protein n=1 Tax=Agromyces sp. GXS1127 TaxID=3424181 RepID=UPI003D323134